MDGGVPRHVHRGTFGGSRPRHDASARSAFGPPRPRQHNNASLHHDAHHPHSRAAALLSVPAGVLLADPGAPTIPDHHSRLPFIDEFRDAVRNEPVELSALAVSLILCALAWFAAPTRQQQAAGAERPVTAAEEASYCRLRNRYLSVFALATFGDWIQGGYLYALYSEYGYSRYENALLCVVGYVSAATVGTYAGAIGDVQGHRRNCIWYGFLYATSCLLCNFGGPAALIISRLLGGIGYSILYTSFESWLNAEADASGVPSHMLSHLFSVATFSSAVSAVVAGIVGHVSLQLVPPVAEMNRFTLPFQIAMVALLLTSLLSATQWSERYGDRQVTASASLLKSWKTIRNSRALLTLGIVNAFYETALYVFVFMWTPTLERRATHPMSHGLVFSIFMLCKMAGAQGFAMLSTLFSPAACLRGVFGGAALCMLVPLLSSSYELVLLAFCVFELLLGIYWPAIAILRAAALDDSQRSSMMAVFRALLNVLVIAVLLLAGKLAEELVFGVAVVLLLVCLGCTTILLEASDREAAVRAQLPYSQVINPALDKVDSPTRHSGAKFSDEGDAEEPPEREERELLTPSKHPQQPSKRG